MSFVDTYNLEKNKNLARQAESLRGLRFLAKGDRDAQFMVFATEVTARGEVYVTGICTGGLLDDDTGNMANGQFYRFPITEISLTLDAIEKFEVRIARSPDATSECCS